MNKGRKVKVVAAMRRHHSVDRRRPLLALLVVVLARRVVAQDGGEAADPSEQGGSVPVTAPVNVGTTLLKMSPEQVRLLSGRRVAKESSEPFLLCLRCLCLLQSSPCLFRRPFGPFFFMFRAV